MPPPPGPSLRCLDVGRSGPHDAWGDPGDDAWHDRDHDPDDRWDVGAFDASDEPDERGLYPPAPLPAHERTWRHPSEVGESMWRRTEPPLVLGRGLLVTSGVIGCALGLAVLLLLVPIGGGLAPSAEPTATERLRLPGTTSAGAEPVRTELVGPAGLDSWGPDATLPAEVVPSTVLIGPDTGEGATSEQPLAIAVAIEHLPWMITTATAVGAHSDVSITGPGANAPGRVVGLEGDLAMIEPARNVEVATFAAVAAVTAGQVVTVLGEHATAVTAPDGGPVAELDPAEIREGTPVVDDQGALVALCTLVESDGRTAVALVPLVPSGEGDGATTVPVDEPDAGTAPDDTTDTDPSVTSAPPPPPSAPDPAAPTSGTTPSTTAPTPTTTAPTPSTGPAPTGQAWAGLRFDGAPATAPLTVTGVVPGSPASVAGIAVGERLVAVDGTSVATVEQLLVELRRRQPGDTVRITLLPRTTGGTTTTTTTTAPSSTTGTAGTAPASTTASAGTTASTPAPAAGTPTTDARNGGADQRERTVALTLAAFVPTV